MRTDKESGAMKVVVEMYDQLKSGDAVAKRLDMSRKTVYRLLHKAGVVLPDRNSPEIYDRRKGLQGDKATEAIQDYVDGMKLKDIFAKYGVSSAGLYTALKDAGIERRPHGGQARILQGNDGKEIVRLYLEEKLSQAQIAGKFGCHQTLISKVLRENGVKIKINARGSDHGNWSGGKTVTDQGYIYVSILADDFLSPMRNRQGYVLEHRLVMARALGRPLEEHESIHHINGDKTNNDISNLQLRIGKHGIGQAYQCLDCGSHNIVPVELKEESISYEI